MSDHDVSRLRHIIELLESELHEHQRQQQALISELQRARAQLQAIDGNITFYDGELLRGG
jgi:chromosome segregation ATPase